jgi:hypothetical protein
MLSGRNSDSFKVIAEQAVADLLALAMSIQHAFRVSIAREDRDNLPLDTAQITRFRVE